jgi:serine/threonine-protein kinase RsbW
MATDRIVLTVPSRDEYARTVRMTAATLVGGKGASIDVVDDVRIAIEEAYIFACGKGEEPAEVTFVFTIEDDLFVAEVESDAVPHEESDDPGGRYARFILESVCDEHELTHEGGKVRARIAKRIV